MRGNNAFARRLDRAVKPIDSPRLKRRNWSKFLDVGL
jgi:hypothetical protein